LASKVFDPAERSLLARLALMLIPLPALALAKVPLACVAVMLSPSISPLIW
jgi:hypothetical protein